jgi:hypothetical protein
MTAMRVKRLTLALPIAVFLAGCGGAGEPRVVPDVRGVCDQEPDAGERAWHVELYVEPSCAGY